MKNAGGIFYCFHFLYMPSFEVLRQPGNFILFLAGTGFSESVLEERSASLRSKVIPKPKVVLLFSFILVETAGWWIFWDFTCDLAWKFSRSCHFQAYYRYGDSINPDVWFEPTEVKLWILSKYASFFLSCDSYLFFIFWFGVPKEGWIFITWLSPWLSHFFLLQCYFGVSICLCIVILFQSRATISLSWDMLLEKSSTES